MSPNSGKRKAESGKQPIRGQRTIIHVLTGNGKGKTTASLGLALRAIGAGKRVKMIQFMKKAEFSEHKAIKKYKLPIEVEAYGIGFYKILGDRHSTEEHQKACQRALKSALEAIESQKYDLIILDEINVALHLKLLEVDEVIQVLRSADSGKRKAELDIILTGRNAHPKIKKIAHLVSEVKKVKHYFDDGLSARQGIEF